MHRMAKSEFSFNASMLHDWSWIMPCSSEFSVSSMDLNPETFTVQSEDISKRCSSSLNNPIATVKNSSSSFLKKIVVHHCTTPLPQSESELNIIAHANVTEIKQI